VEVEIGAAECAEEAIEMVTYPYSLGTVMASIVKFGYSEVVLVWYFENILLSRRIQGIFIQLCLGPNNTFLRSTRQPSSKIYIARAVRLFVSTTALAHG